MPPRSAFASRSRYEILGEHDVDVESEESEVEEAPIVLAPPIQTKPAANGTSKSAQKKEARQRKKASSGSEADSSSVLADAKLAPKPETVSAAVHSAKGTVSNAVPEQGKVQLPSATAVKQNVEQVASSAVQQASAIAGKVQEAATKQVSSAVPAMESAVNKANETAGHIKAQPSKAYAEARAAKSGTETSVSSAEVASKSKAPPSVTPFNPSLPSSLPHPPTTADSIPSNRKRKPTDALPGSPNSKGVKFQDGLLPGEGKEGEKIIKGVDRHVRGSSEVQGGKGLVQQGEADKKSRNVVERTIWTFIMIGGFIALLCMGHPYMILLVMVCQTLVYKEVTALFALRDHGGSVQAEASSSGRTGDAWNKTLNWYFFVVTNYFLYGESIIYYFKHIVFIDAYFLPFAKNHRFISFMLYMVGFVAFVANLQKGYLRQQFALFCWVHMTLLAIVVSSHFIVNNILEGLIWFFVPASLVICNDVMAYVCGKLFGKTPLIKLSPKKTVEGFVGAFFCTLLFGLAWGTFFMRFKYMICPAQDLGVSILSKVDCVPNPVFLWKEIQWPQQLEVLAEKVLHRSMPTLSYSPFQLHVLVMATFASLVAPFGGFFASGFKRAFNIKDFGHSIPGHGGMTDRMDCQFMMGLFSYVYYSSLIRVHHVTVGSVLQTIVSSLTVEEQVEVLVDLKRYLDGQGVKLNAAIRALGK